MALIPHTPRDLARSGRRLRLEAAAIVFLVAALGILALAPAVLLERVERNAEGLLTTFFPAHVGINALELALEQRRWAMSNWRLTGDPQYLRRAAEADSVQARAIQDLTTVAPHLGAEFSRRVAALRSHARMIDLLEYARLQPGGGEVSPELEGQRASFDARLSDLRSELVEVVAAGVESESGLARRQLRVSYYLGALALIALLVILWAAHRQRRLSAELQRALTVAEQERSTADERRAELERVTESRVRILRGITHDVKNPLGAAKGYAELLELGIKAPLDPAQVPLVQGVHRSLDGALAIIEDLLDLAKADTAGLKVNRALVDLSAVAREAAEEHRSAAEAAGHVLEFESADAPLTVYTDAGRVRQVLSNLLSNAIKYTPPPGRISIRSGPVPEDEWESPEWVAVSVADTGPGIPPSQREAVFEEFSRLDEEGGQKGHGLGLAIARRMAQLLKGDLEVEDAPEGGALFVLRLPIRSTDPEATPQAP